MRCRRRASRCRRKRSRCSRQWIAQGAKTARAEPEEVPKYLDHRGRARVLGLPADQAPDDPPKVERRRTRANADRCVSPREARSGRGSLQPRGGQGDAAPPRDARPHRPAADAGGGRPLFLADDAPDAYERLVDRAARLAALRRTLGPALARRRGLRRLRRLHRRRPGAPVGLPSIATTSSARSTRTSRSTNSSASNSPATRWCTPPLQEPRARRTSTSSPPPASSAWCPTAPRAHRPREQKTARNAVVAETIKVVSSSLLGMTVGCAQCHDHRLRSRSRRRTTTGCARSSSRRSTREAGARPPARLVSLMTDAERAKAAEVEKEAKVDRRRSAR